jgi:methylisocitrate lyase
MHIEDQVQAKRCGHRPGKELVPAEEMVDRIKAAVDARRDPSFVIMARTDAIAVEGVENALARAKAYVDAGADMIFAEAVTRLEDYEAFARTAGVPILANITEFGQTPLFTLEELAGAQVSLALYPLSAFRAMSAAALKIYKTLRQLGTQAPVIAAMQTRAELYEVLNYYQYEQKLDQLFTREKK